MASNKQLIPQNRADPIPLKGSTLSFLIQSVTDLRVENSNKKPEILSPKSANFASWRAGAGHNSLDVRNIKANKNVTKIILIVIMSMAKIRTSYLMY